MEIFNTQAGAELLARWTHFLAGITWIGLLYYFNFVQGPSFAAFDAAARTEATRKLVPRALAWFRYAALVTWLAGFGLIISRIDSFGWANWDDLLTNREPLGLPILTGMVLGTIMFLNVWGVIWPKQKIVIANAERTATGGEADPKAPDAARRALLASRTNVVMSVPMLFFMATSAHGALVPDLSFTARWLYALIAGIVVAAAELNALAGKTGALKKPLEKVGSSIFTGFVLFGIIYTVYQLMPEIE